MRFSLLILSISFFFGTTQPASAQSLIQDAYQNRRNQQPKPHTGLVNQKKFCHYSDSGKITYCYFFEKECVEKLKEEKSGSCKQEILGGTGQVVGQ